MDRLDVKLSWAHGGIAIATTLQACSNRFHMKRDMDLIRLLLLSLEGDAGATQKVSEYPKDQILYHKWLLLDGGLAIGNSTSSGVGVPNRVQLTSLNWKGHEFIDAFRSDTVWAATKEYFIKPGVAFTVDALLTWVKMKVPGLYDTGGA